jgi:hypothetical protein
MKNLFLAFLLIFLNFHVKGQNLFINEIVASNNLDQMDEFFEFDDWMEIYNAGGILNLAGYYLSDDPLLLTKFQIPATNAALTTALPNSHIIFWCDNDDLTQGENHTNFTLKSGGETVFLTAPDGLTIIDSVTYAPLASDISYGRTCDGCPNWQYFNNTTWDAANQEIINPNGELLFINEVQTLNTNTIHDLEFEYDPWIEIYNPNTFQVNIGGYVIYNGNLTYTIPTNNPIESIIPPGGFRNLWFDNDLNQGVLHIGLDLPDQGTITMYGPNGTSVVNQYNYNNIPIDQSWGRTTDGAANSIVFSQPTPTVTNSLFLIAGENLIINEIMAKNLTTITDNFGEYEDWIEIYNPNDYPVNMSGYYMSDNPEVRNRWVIPSSFPDSVTIPAQSWMLYYCDGDNNQGVLHANFSLSNGGEYAGLFSPDGFSLIDEVQWEFIGADTSYGRQYDGDANWIQFLVSTPDASNGTNPNGIDFLKITEIQLYPNPAIHEIYLNEKNNVRVYNQQGKLIYQKAQINKISVTDWPNGQYILTTDQGKSIKFEIIH